MKKKQQEFRLSVRIPPELAEQMHERLEKVGVSRTQQVIRGLALYFEAVKKEEK